MIPITDLSWQHQSWQSQLAGSIRTTAELAEALGIELPEVETDFPVNVPLAYLSRIRSGDAEDPLLLQVLARNEELTSSGQESPLEEAAFSKGFGVIQKYQGRLLVITTGACAIHCRYCFRRHFPYSDYQPSSEDWLQVLDKVRQDTSISEVILSGGDPLMLNDRRLAWIIAELDKIAHIDTIRLHSRLPIVVPGRISPDLLSILGQSRCQIVVVTHVNHGNEIDNQVIEACQQLSKSGVTLLNQSVLLRGVNDSGLSLAELSRQLIRAGIVPYYLHLMDPVLGAEHFDVDEQIGIKLIQQLRDQLPGYLVPRLSREVPFEAAKKVIA